MWLVVVVGQWCGSASTARDIMTAISCGDRFAGGFFVSTER